MYILVEVAILYSLVKSPQGFALLFVGYLKMKNNSNLVSIMIFVLEKPDTSSEVLLWILFEWFSITRMFEKMYARMAF